MKNNIILVFFFLWRKKPWYDNGSVLDWEVTNDESSSIRRLTNTVSGSDTIVEKKKIEEKVWSNWCYLFLKTTITAVWRKKTNIYLVIYSSWWFHFSFSLFISFTFFFTTLFQIIRSIARNKTEWRKKKWRHMNIFSCVLRYSSRLSRTFFIIKRNKKIKRAYVNLKIRLGNF
jgi:hypothetical protein